MLLFLVAILLFLVAIFLFLGGNFVVLDGNCLRPICGFGGNFVVFGGNFVVLGGRFVVLVAIFCVEILVKLTSSGAGLPDHRVHRRRPPHLCRHRGSVQQDCLSSSIINIYISISLH